MFVLSDSTNDFMRTTAPAISTQNAFYYPNYYEAHCSFSFALMEFISSIRNVGFILIVLTVILSLPDCAGRVKASHLTSLCEEPTKTRPLSQLFRRRRLVLDHLKRPVNKAESFRYKPSESEPLQWSTDSQKYH